MLPDFELWLDNQLSAMIAKRIKEEFGYTAKSCFMLEAQKWSDMQLLREAKAQHKLIIIISKDGDFPQLIAQHGVPPKLIKINTGNIRTEPLWQLLKSLLPEAVRILTTTEKEIVYIQSPSSY